MEEGFEGSHDVQDNRGRIDSVRSNKIWELQFPLTFKLHTTCILDKIRDPSDQINGSKTQKQD